MHHSSLIALIGAGHSAEVFRLAGGRVLKLFRRGVHPDVIAREHDGASRAHAAGLPVARPIGWETVDDRTGLIFEELHGRPLLDAHGNWRIDRIARTLGQLASCHADIHRCDAAGLHHRQHNLLRIRIERAAVPHALRDRALAALHDLPEGDRLCHGDLHPGNVIEAGDRIAPIDWANASAGDPAADVVRTEILLRYGRYGAALRSLPFLRRLRALAARHYVGRYRALTGMGGDRLERWWLPVAVSCLIEPSHIHHAALLSDRRFQAA